ncbi:MAG: ATP-binding protein [Clostridia bacterium]|nr:ATP-binding protein [Clostridia bacterium]MBO7178485.1 ATP-binding protein [Clostridia bacterium]
MSDALHLEFDVAGNNFVSAGGASDEVKKTLKMLGVSTASIRKVAIAMYEGEINMVIHAGGGRAIVDIYRDKIVIVLSDNGPGIPDINLALTEGYSTATDSIRDLGFGAGMGLPNMKKYTDEFKIESVVGEGTTVTMVVNFS